MRTQWIDWNKPELSPKKLTLSLGGFDGIHLGHQFLIKKLVKKAKENKTPSALCIFDPLPFQVLSDIKPFKRLLTLSELESLLKELKLDFFCIIPFNKEISKTSPKDFIESFLIPHFNPKHILIGYDFSFAYKRKGDFSLLKSYQKKYDFSLEKAPVFLQKKKKISSSLIRKHLKLGEVETVKELLGRPFSIESRVIQGSQRARKLGFPTANLKLDGKEYPCLGVYKAIVTVKHAPTPYKAVVNIGYRPTFCKKLELLVEVYIPGINLDLYGQTLKLELESFIRKEQVFKNSEDLKEQIKKDIKKL